MSSYPHPRFLNLRKAIGHMEATIESHPEILGLHSSRRFGGMVVQG